MKALSTRLRAGLALLFVPGLVPVHAQGQSGAPFTPATQLDSLIALALAAHPLVRADAARVDAARARISPARARPDPKLMAGIQNFPISDPGFDDFMTMQMIGIEQMLPYPGKLGLRTAAAEAGARAAEARLESARRVVMREVQDAWYDLVEAELAFGNAARYQALLAGIIPATDARYAAGEGDQGMLLAVRREAAHVAIEAVMLQEGRRSALARLNAAVGRPADAPVADPQYPPFLLRAADGERPTGVQLASQALGGRAAGSPLLPLDSLLALAIDHNAFLQVHAAEIDAQASEVALARKEHLPDLAVAVSYGQRAGAGDLVSATVSLPLPLQRRRTQDHLVVAAGAELAAREAARNTELVRLRAEIARLVADFERDRTMLSLLRSTILPLDDAAVATASANVAAGRSTLMDLTGRLADRYRTETQYARTLASLGRTLAQLTELVGTEVLR